MINKNLSKISEFGIWLIQWFGDFSKDIKVLQIRTLNSIIRFLMEIGPLPARRMESFFPGAIDSQILNALAELFLPSDKEIQIRYIIQQEDARFRLGIPDEQGAYLGISTYL